ncbi:MAG TPA: acetyl-CoA carboxylase carboxyltransferase subunit alpha, partial [Chitinophagales bacterium]|nr:acetyl-CoA carboxylase carboxyltransferase subunit alpha [Chitinophagales bacterium]
EKVDVSKTIVELEQKLVLAKQRVYKNLSRWQRVQLSRHPERPYTLYYIQQMFDNFVELHGDRQVADDKAIVGGLASLNGKSVMVIGHQKGTDTKSRQYRNFGMANPEGYRKALRLMHLAEKFDKPVICFIDTPGAYPGLEAEERGQAEAIARNLFEMSRLPVPIICVIIGEGASGGALGIGIGDRILMLENTWYSVISPESCSSILWHTWEHKEKAAEALRLTPQDMLQFKLIDEIVQEPFGGAHHDPAQTAATLKNTIEKYLTDLLVLNKKTLVSQRIQKFSTMGEFAQK